MSQEPLRNLNGSAIVTGGASGLGRACVERLRAEGMPVLVADVNGESGTDLARADEGVELRRTDVRNADEVEAAVQQAAGLSSEGLRLSVACAEIGSAERILGKRGPHNVDRFLSVVQVNLVGTFLLLRSAAEAMAQNEPVDGERGVHVSTASAAALESRSVRSRMRRPRAASSGSRFPRPAISRSTASACARSLQGCSPLP